MATEILEAEGITLVEAREKQLQRVPDGWRIISETVINDGSPKTLSASAESKDDAIAELQSQLSKIEDDIVDDGFEEMKVTLPETESFFVEAFDQSEAGMLAEKKAQFQLGGNAQVNNVKLIKPGSKGFLGIGRKPNQYEIETIKPAVVEVVYTTKVKISTKICDENEIILEAIRKRETNSIAEFGELAIDTLLPMLGNFDLSDREFAVDALVRIGSPSVKPLISILNASDWSVAQSACLALGKIGDPEAADPLIFELSHGHERLGNEKVKWAAAEALGVIGDPKAVEPLIEALEKGPWKAKQTAAWALGEIGDERAIEPLEAVCERPNYPKVIRAAEVALQEIKIKSFMETFTSDLMASPIEDSSENENTR